MLWLAAISESRQFRNLGTIGAICYDYVLVRVLLPGMQSVVVHL